MKKKSVQADAGGHSQLLGIESSGQTCTVGLSRNGQLIAQVGSTLPHIHSRQLAPFCRTVFRTAGITPEALSAIAISAGPGSFTGLRIGYSLAKGLAHSLNIPIIEVPTLDVWVWQNGPRRRPVLAVIDARRNEIFCAMYRWKGSHLQKVMDDALLPVAELSGLITEQVVVVGADAARFGTALMDSLPPGSCILQPAAAEAQIWALLQLAEEKFHSEEFVDLSACQPHYLRAFGGVL